MLQSLRRSSDWHCMPCPHAQGDINEVSKIAHTIKARLERLDGDNAKALRQQVGR